MANKDNKAPLVYCFLDTNILHHFQTFDEVDWPSVLNAKQVCLVLVPVVLRELDKHKDDYNNERRRNRARMLLSKLKRLLEAEPNAGQLPQVRVNATLMVLSSEPLINWAEEHLDPNIEDDRLLASILEFRRQHLLEYVLLLTDDFLLHLKAKSHTIPALSPEGVVPSLERPSAKEATIQKVIGLVPGMNISMYRDTFGAPPIINHNEEKKTKEYVFAHPSFYLQAVTDNNDTVLYFALTVRDKTFNPLFKSPNQYFQIMLGVSRFSDISGVPEYIGGCLGARTFSYYETRYLGNPGHYKNFGFGLNQSGCQLNNLTGYFSVFDKNSQFCPGTSSITEQDLATLKDFRTRAIINTYAVSAPFVSIKDYAGSNLGVSYDQVRTLNI